MPIVIARVDFPSQCCITIDFNEVDMRIYLPEKVIFTKAAALVNITFFGR